MVIVCQLLVNPLLVNDLYVAEKLIHDEKNIVKQDFFNTNNILK